MTLHYCPCCAVPLNTVHEVWCSLDGVYTEKQPLFPKEQSQPNAPLPEPKGKGDDSGSGESADAEPEGEVEGQDGESKEIKDIFDDYHEARDEAYRRTIASNDMGTIKHYYQARMIYIDGKPKWKVESSR